MCLVDFGVSFRLGERVASQGYEGTVAYSAPEILLLGENEKCDITPASDMYALGIVMYVLLCGVHPFDKFNSLSEDEIRKHILDNKLDLNDKFSDFLSDKARDLLEKLLHRKFQTVGFCAFSSTMLLADPSKRITAAEALQHPWLLSQSALDTKLLGDRTEKLRKFQRGRRRLRASILAVLLNSAPTLQDPKPELPQAIQHPSMSWGISSNSESAQTKTDTMISALKVFDKDNKGYISKKDLQRVSSDLG